MTGDRAINDVAVNQPDPNAHNLFWKDGLFDPKSNAAASSSSVERYAEVTAKGIADTPTGIVHAIADDITHPFDTIKMIGTSAAIGAGLKLLLPETGSIGKLVGVGIGAYFAYKASTPIINAYKEAGSATTEGQINQAAMQFGDGVGSFGVNSAVSGIGYKLGAGAMGSALTSEKADGFMEAKHNFYEGLDAKASGLKDSAMNFLKGSKVDTADSVGVSPRTAASNFTISGDKAVLHYSDKAAPKGQVVGEVDPNAEVNVTLLAKTKGSNYLMDRYINRISEGAKPLTDAEITQKFGVDANSAAAVRDFAAKNGLQITDTNDASGRFFLKGTAAQMEQAFGTKLNEYENNGVKFRGREGSLQVSSDLAPHIKGVLGLDNRPQYRTNYVRLSDLPAELQPEAIKANAAGAEPKSGSVRPMDPEEAFKAYNAPAGLDGQGMTTGFLSLGGTMPEGWNDYLQSKGINPDTFKQVNVGDQPPQPDPQGANGENALDGVIHKQGLPKATTVMIQAPNSDTGMPDGIDRMTFPKAGESQITHGSISWGMFEDGWTDQARAAMEDAGKRAALKGITITVAAGDNGAGDGSRSGVQQVDIPAGLANFTAAGGTQLALKADGSYGGEKVWGVQKGEGATGGGVSLDTPRPPYQDGINIPKNLGGGNFDGRGVPDAAWNADPRSGINTFLDGGQTEPIGGTSAAAPEGAVVAAKISEATGQNTGFWNNQLYKFGKSNPSVFNDVTVGDNTDEGIQGYKAGKGWDATTGWGSVNVGNYIDAVKQAAGRSRFQILSDASLSAITKPSVGEHVYNPVVFNGSVVNSNDQQPVVSDNTSKR